MNAALLERLRATDPAASAGPLGRPLDAALLAEWERSGVLFVAAEAEAQHCRALRELLSCIGPMTGAEALLQEGGIYLGCGLESTGTISAELLSRFLASVAGATHAAFAAHQRADGLLPYKLTGDGPAFAQIQLVTPPARCVWNHHLLHGGETDALRAQYPPWRATTTGSPPGATPRHRGRGGVLHL
jgi:hypothetical protein